MLIDQILPGLRRWQADKIEEPHLVGPARHPDRSLSYYNYHSSLRALALNYKKRPVKTAALLIAATAMGLAYPAYSDSLSATDKAALTKILKDNETVHPTQATLSQVQALIDKNPKDYLARLVMGNTLDRVGMPMQAIEQYQLAVQYGPDSPKAIIELVKAQIGVGQKEAAMRLLQEAEKRFPNDREITFWMGNYYLSRGDMKEAEAHFRKVSQSGPAFMGMGSAQGEIQLRQRRFGMALIMANSDLAKNPGYPLANAVKGQALYFMHRYKEALAPLMAAYVSSPLRGDYAKYFSQVCLLTGEVKLGLEPAVVALALSTRSYDADNATKFVLDNILSQLPYAYVQQQVPSICEKLDKQIVNPRWHFTLGEMFDNYGYHNLACVQFQRALQIDPNQAQAAFRLANDLEMYFQKYDEAVLYLTQAHSLDPRDTEIADRLDRLKSRLPIRERDLAWRLKDMIRSQRSPI